MYITKEKFKFSIAHIMDNFSILNLIFGAIGIIGLFLPIVIFSFNGGNLISPYADNLTLFDIDSMEFKISGVSLLVSSCPALLDSLISVFTCSLIAPPEDYYAKQWQPIFQ